MTDASSGAIAASSSLSSLGARPARRRTVLLTSAATGVAASLTTALDTVLAEPAEARGLPTRLRLQSLVGRVFTASHAGRTTRWRLDAVHDSPFRPAHLHGNHLTDWRHADFVLEWSTRSDAHQATYTMRHSATGSFRMFAVPGKVQDGRTSVTAVFNRWRG
jgi:hypothetical protein